MSTDGASLGFEARPRAASHLNQRPLRVAAVDLGATSGRVMSGRITGERVEINELHRFPNGAVRARGSLLWDVLGIHRESLAGIRKVAQTGPLHGIGIDSWAIDYGLIGRDGELLGSPYSHRDARTDGVAEKVVAELGAADLYATTGIQQLPFNTLYQLVAARGSAALEAAETLLLLPDLLGYWLTGVVGAERTNASTTQLYDVRSGDWALDLCRRLGLPWAVLPPLRDPGTVVGPLLPDVARDLGVAADLPVVAVGSHDTASAVVGVPAETDRFAYISSGTWSLVGLELDRPVLTEEARLADFTNELGVDGTVRFLKNVTGLWVLSESLRSWSERGYQDVELGSLIAAAARFDPLRTVIDINDPRLLPPSTAADPMPERVAAIAAETVESGAPVPVSPVALTRCIVDSLAIAYRRHVRTASELAGVTLEVVHVVGGGSQNEVLCQLTADACGLPVVAGPVEAAALGNVLVQGRALGADLPDLASMRALASRSFAVRRYQPRDHLDWAAAEARVFDRAG